MEKYQFAVCGVDDSGLTVLYESYDRFLAMKWLDKYVARGAGENWGNWDLIEVYDRRRDEDPGAVVIKSWERPPLSEGDLPEEEGDVAVEE